MLKLQGIFLKKILIITVSLIIIRIGINIKAEDSFGLS